MSSTMNLATQIETNQHLNKDEFNLFYDWFCQDRALPARAKKLMSFVKAIANSAKFDKNNVYVFFKNNSPMWTKETYDSFSICDLESGDVLYWVAPEYPESRNKRNCVVFDVKNGSVEEPVFRGSILDAVAFFHETN